MASTHEGSPRAVTRNTFLKLAGATLFVAAIGGIDPFDYQGRPPDLSARPSPHIPRPADLPEDVLSEEELKGAGITIYQTEDTQLYLRRDVFDLPLFRDVKGGKLEGVVISLVDSDALSWNSVSKLPLDARSVWLAQQLHPSEYPEKYWQDLDKYENDMVAYDRNSIEFWQSVLEKLPEDTITHRELLEHAKEELAKDGSS